MPQKERNLLKEREERETEKKMQVLQYLLKDTMTSDLLGAVAVGDIDEVKRTIAGGANIDYRSIFQSNMTVLMEAVAYGHLDIVQVLIKAGIDVNAKDDFNETALIYAVRGDWVNIVKVLIEAGADTQVKDKSNMTALTYAKRGNYADIISLLESVDVCKKDS